VTKLVAEVHGKGDHRAIERCVSTALVLLAAVAVLAILIAAGSRRLIAAAFGLQGAPLATAVSLIPYAAGLSVYSMMVQVQLGVLTGLGRLDQANLAQVTGRVVAVLVAGVLLWRGRGVDSLLVADLLATGTVQALSTRWVRQTGIAGRFRLDAVDRPMARRLLGFGSGILGAQLFDLLWQPLNRLLLSRHAGVAALTHLQIGYAGAMQVRALFESGFRALVPEVSRAQGMGEQLAVERGKLIVRRAMLPICVVAAPVFGLLALGAPWLLRVWLGGRFAPPQVDILRLMLGVAFISLLAVPSYYVLLGLGNVRIIVAAHAVQGAANSIMVSLFVLVTGSLDLVQVGLGFGAGAAAASALLWCSQKRRFHIAGVRAGAAVDSRRGRPAGGS
jgi:O-antigen/teichoic acid export membrane protein